MFSIKKKIKLTDDERRIILYALNDFRTESLKEGKYVDIINEAMCKVKPKMKIEKESSTSISFSYPLTSYIIETPPV